MIGPTLDHYRILEELGSGGTGVVYRAFDEYLRRDVAVKVLSAELVGATQGRVRFEREARALAALNHPNIASIYDVEDSCSSAALVMEMVEGPTLAERLLQGPIAIPEALRIGCQIAAALECAHAQGVIHRDLKPGNVKLRQDGTVKVLDFGLAKFVDPRAGDPEREPSTTTQSDVTSRPGFVVGTLPYMSPEQARGCKVDERADIWAFGVVLFEMLSGKRAFQGTSSSDVIAAILKEYPDWSALPSDTPLLISRLLLRCLAKEPKQRLHAIADARLDMEEVLGKFSVDSRAPVVEVPPPGFRLLHRPLTWVVFGIVAAVASGLSLLQRNPASILRPSARYSINLPSDAPLAPASAMPLAVGRSSLALSPDGTHLVYVALVKGETKLYVRDMARGDFGTLAGTEGAHSPFFSPDGQWVGFFADDKLKKVSISGGQPIVLANATLGFGGSWAGNEAIYFSTDYASRIYRIPANGGPSETVVGAGSRFPPLFFPQILPENRGILYSPQIGGLAAFDLGSARTNVLLKNGTFPHYTPTGHILFSYRNTLQAAPFDLQRPKVVGTPTRLLDEVRSERDGAAQFTYSDDGTLVYATGVDGTLGVLVWVDAGGRKRSLGAPAGDYDAFRISPDGRYVALPIRSETGTDIWVFDTQRGITSRLTANGKSTAPVWSPEGRFIYFLSWQTGVSEIYRKRTDGTGDEQILTNMTDVGLPYSISPDGQRLLFQRIDAKTKEDLWVLRLREGEQTRDQTPDCVPFLRTEFSEVLAAISPDGRWAAYTSDETGRWEVYVSSFPNPGAKIRISNSGGEEPVWSRNGRELYYRFGTKWYAVNVTLGDHITATRPRLRLQGPFVNIPGFSYDVAPDGRDFLVVEAMDQSKTITELNVVTNFWDELRRRLPSGR